MTSSKDTHKYILITIDVEEFDIPREYGIDIPEADSIEVSRQGLERLSKIISSFNIPCTIYTTALFAKKQPQLIRSLADRHEIASHGYYHSNHGNDDLRASKNDIEDIIGKMIYGYRQPRLMPVDTKTLSIAGYTYNSSINPTWIPLRYMNLNKPKKPFHDGNIMNLPISVTPFIRFPLFWLSFKNLPVGLYKRLSVLTLNRDRYLHLIFHPWEFADIEDYKLPNYIKRPCGMALCDRLSDFLGWIRHHGTFVTCQGYLKLTL
ncbi:MAG: polysaccharide deacetylase family protein [Thermodesulfovibrionales bacterium]